MTRDPAEAGQAGARPAAASSCASRPTNGSCCARSAPQLREVLVRQATAIEHGADPAVDRLFPVAYPDDEERQTEYRLLAHDQLLESHLGALAVLEETADADRLDEDQLRPGCGR